MDQKITQDRVNAAIISYKNRKREIDFPDDVAHIRSTILDTFGVNLSPYDTMEFWEWYSEFAWFAGWIGNPSQGEIARGFPRWVAFMEGASLSEIAPGWDD